MSRVVVVGAGAMGLAAAYHAVKRGHRVTLVEAAPEAGGMAAHFDLGGLSIERFYHFICKPDAATFALLDELGIGAKMRWTPTSMGYFVDGTLYPWGNPLSLMKFPKLSFRQKILYGGLMLQTSRRTDMRDLENVSAKEWISKACGSDVYNKLWAPLFELKFFEYADNISAAWVATRIKRVASSRRSPFQEELGYIEGGTETLVRALVDAITAKGGDIRLHAPVSRIETKDGRVSGVTAGGTCIDADAVICTAPTPFVSRLVPDLPAVERARYDAIRNIGVVCVVFRLKRSVSPHFWTNIVDSRIKVPGIVEFSRLRPVGDTVVYLPYYMPVSNPKFVQDDEAFRAESLRYLKLVNPALGEGDVIACHVARLRYAQPVCPPGFAAQLPPVVTSIAGLQIADTAFYYPEDRGISESVRLGKQMAERIA